MAVIGPLGSAPADDAPEEHARRPYLDQLKELERAAADGRISASEPEAARAEIARRLIATDAAESSAAHVEGSIAARRATALAALVGIPLISLGFYLALGSPNVPVQP